MTDLYECSYCLYYARPTSFSDEIDDSQRFVGSRSEVIKHADIHPIGAPEDCAIPYEPKEE